jgi:hypothetical protein
MSHDSLDFQTTRNVMVAGDVSVSKTRLARSKNRRESKQYARRKASGPIKILKAL